MKTKGLKILFFKPFVFSDPHSNFNRHLDLSREIPEQKTDGKDLSATLHSGRDDDGLIFLILLMPKQPGQQVWFSKCTVPAVMVCIWIERKLYLSTNHF